MIEKANTLELCRFKPGDILFREGDQSYHFFMIKEGKVEIFRETEDGQKIDLAVIDEGQSLGEFAMIDRQPRSASARAIEPVLAVKISEQGYQGLLDELPTWAHAMLEGLVIRLRKANEIIQKNESIDEQTKTDYKAIEFNTESDVKFDFDFSSVQIDAAYDPSEDS